MLGLVKWSFVDLDSVEFSFAGLRMILLVNLFDKVFMKKIGYIIVQKTKFRSSYLEISCVFD